MEKVEQKMVRCNVEKMEPKNTDHEHESGHPRRRSTGSFAFSDSQTVPNYLRASKGSCHNRCKSGFITEDEQVTKSSGAAMGGYSQKKKKKSAVDLEAALDSITRTSKVTKKETDTSRAKVMPGKIRGDSSLTAQQPRRSYTDFVNSRRLRCTEKNQFIGSDSGRSGELGTIKDIKHTRLVNKNVGEFPERSSAVTGSRSIIPKKPRSTTTVQHRKQFTEHVPEKIQHVIETKAESRVTGISLGSTDSLDSSSDEKTWQKEATTSELVQCEETSRCMGITANSEKQKIDSSEDDRTCQKEAAIGNNTAKIKSTVISNESKDLYSSPRKLKVRGGKVIPEQQVENSTNELNFRKGVLTENQDINLDVSGVSLRKTETVVPRICPNEQISSVQLRGQVDEGNNGSQGSYNALIEETANKLSQTKSKVKALVGAFESVISLADTNCNVSPRKIGSVRY